MAQPEFSPMLFEFLVFQLGYPPDECSLDLTGTYKELSRIDRLQQALRPASDKLGREGPDDVGIPKSRDLENPCAIGLSPSDSAVHQEIEARRIDLRARAWDLSRDKIRPLSISSLPIDLLYEIFAYLGKGDGLNEAIRLRDAQNARRACRLFNQLAAPFLFSTLYVSLGMESLQTALEISRNPLLASGVREVILRLDYRPKELATDLETFMRFRHYTLNLLTLRCMNTRQNYHRLDNTGQSLSPDKLDELSRCEDAVSGGMIIMIAMQYIRAAEMSCPQYFDEEKFVSARNLVLDGYVSYRQKQEEQRRLIEEKVFVKSLVEAMTRMPQATSVTFTDRSSKDMPHALAILTDKAELTRVLTGPETWRSIERPPGGVVGELLPVRLLSDLPIALAAAGRPLKGINVCCYSIASGHSMLCPSTQEVPGWGTLRNAFSRLEVLKFGQGGGNMTQCGVIPGAFGPGDWKCIDNYIGAMLASPCLREVCLSLYAFSRCTSRAIPTHLGEYTADVAISRLQSTRIRRAELSGLVLNGNTLRKFCDSLDDDLVYLSLNSIRLLGGSWGGARDVISKRFAKRCREGECTIRLGDLVGEEYRRGSAYDPNSGQEIDYFLSEDWAAAL